MESIEGSVPIKIAKLEERSSHIEKEIDRIDENQKKKNGELESDLREFKHKTNNRMQEIKQHDIACIKEGIVNVSQKITILEKDMQILSQDLKSDVDNIIKNMSGINGMFKAFKDDVSKAISELRQKVEEFSKDKAKVIGIIVTLSIVGSIALKFILKGFL
jgi:predicted  nucleic acid-binding Zn-ribbon protein